MALFATALAAACAGNPDRQTLAKLHAVKPDVSEVKVENSLDQAMLGYRRFHQKARAFDELGRTEDAIAVIEQLIARYPRSRHLDEVEFRRAEYFFVRKRFVDAEKAYASVTALGARSEYYELALYKLGWSLYKQDLLEEALHEYVALLDY